MSRHRRASGRGFTLVELLIGIGIIGFLAAAVLVAVDPVKRVQDSRNARRWTEINAILNAIVSKQAADEKPISGSSGHPIIDGPEAQIIVATDANLPDCGTLPPSCPGFSDGLNLSTSSSCYANLNASDGTDAMVPKYLPAIPTDPVGGPEYSATNTGYYVNRTGGRVEIGACSPEQTAVIKAQRSSAQP